MNGLMLTHWEGRTSLCPCDCIMKKGGSHMIHAWHLQEGRAQHTHFSIFSPTARVHHTNQLCSQVHTALIGLKTP